jgi:hypothetical protein
MFGDSFGKFFNGGQGFGGGQGFRRGTGLRKKTRSKLNNDNLRQLVQIASTRLLFSESYFS